MPRTYRPPKTRARAAADPANSEAAQRRAQRLRKRASARPGRSARHARSATRHRGKPKDEQVPLVKGARLTGEGHKAAARGEAEYQQLVNRFEGHVHLSRGRPAAANARLKLLASSSSARRRSSGSRPMGSAPVPTGRRRIATPPPRDDELASPSDSDSDSDSDSPGEAGDPIGQPSKVQAEAPVFVVQGQHARAGREYGPEQKKESALSASKAAGPTRAGT